MASFDIFNSDAFSMQQLTAAINELPYVPGRIGELGLFSEEGITTTSVMVEKDVELITLLPLIQRGAPGTITKGSKHSLISLAAQHIKSDDTIMADEVQNLRAFGSETEQEAIESVAHKRLEKMRRRIELTNEYLRLCAIKGKLVDPETSATVIDFHSQFGVGQQTVAFALDTSGTELLGKCLDVQESIESALGSIGFSGVRVLCGKTFWRNLILHPKRKETYLSSTLAAAMRNDPRESMDFGGITFERYRGAGQVAISDTEAYAFPEGVPGLFETYYSPGTYIEAANTIGLPLYAKTEAMEFGVGIKIQAQSSPLHLCTRPRAVIKLTAS